MTSALITGITGQDGSYLTEYLLEEGYDVYGLVRRSSTKHYWRIQHVLDEERLTLIEGDMTDQGSLTRAVRTADPDEVYNLAAQSFVGTSFKQPIYTQNVTSLGVTRLLEAVRSEAPEARVYQASTSEMFGEVGESPQNEETDFYPRSPYGIAKLSGHWSTVNYRDAYDMYAVSGILFNHESPRRGEEFVTRKITLGAARIAEGIQDELRLGNLDARRDWGDTRDYVKAMHLMLQQDPDDLDDYVIGTGETHTVRECVRIAFDELGLDWNEYVVIDDEFYRPAEVNVLQADSSRAAAELDWTPDVSFDQLVENMVQADHERVKCGDQYWLDTNTETRPQSARPTEE
jgi:GDPmannose 4,6-dehydratase